jgi:hypothetical protein
MVVLSKGVTKTLSVEMSTPAQLPTPPSPPQTIWRKVKTTLEWARLGKFVFDLIVSIGSLKLFKKLLSYIPQLSQDWATIIAWAVAAAVLFFLLWWQEKRKATGQGSGLQNASSSLLNSSTLNASSLFATAYTSAMREEIESNVRAAAQLNSPNDHEGFYVKLITIGLVSYTYDIIWAYIFRSQILALMELNRRVTPIAEIKEFYDKAVTENPDRYATYPFDQWMEFLKSNQLLIWHPSGMVQITVRGQDFLKYLTHCGRYPDDRTY